MPRAKTRPGRLAALDRVLLARERTLLTRRGGPFAHAVVVDVGLGAMPWTTLELASTLHAAVDPDLQVVGLDVQPDVVQRACDLARDLARSGASPGARFEVADLALPGLVARVVRVLNVLRDYAPADIPAAHARLGAMLIHGGVLLEGSCGPEGEVGVVHSMRRHGDQLVREALWLWTDGSRGSAPILFRDRLPRDLRRSVVPDHPLGRLMHEWMAAHARVPGAGLQRLDASVRALDRPDLTLLASGFVAWAPEGGVPAPAAL